MSKRLRLSIFEIVGSPLCVASKDGQKICDRLELALKKGLDVTLSFSNVNTLTAAFLNTAIGQLYGIFREEKIRSLLSVEDMQQDDIALLKHVVDSAKRYHQHRTENLFDEG